MSNQLAVIDVPAEPIADSKQLATQIRQLSDQCNLVLPVQNPGYIPAGYEVSLRAVLIQPNDTYWDKQFCKESEAALGKTGIMKLLQAAGGSVVSSERTDDGSRPYFWAYRVQVEIPGPDGVPRLYTGTKEIDLTDGSPLNEKSSAARVRMSRLHGAAMCESKAINRAVRAGLSLHQKYPVEQLQRPFVTMALVPKLDTSDPEVRRLMAAKALGLTRELYGGTVTPTDQEAPALPSGQAQAALPEAHVDATPAADIDGPDPWDEPEESEPAPPKSVALPPFTEQQLAGKGGPRLAALKRISALAQALYEKVGDGTEDDLRRMIRDVDLLADATPLAKLSAIGKDLRKLLESA